jgi:hypothetical protein
MIFKEQLRAHIGGLVRLKTELYWYHLFSCDGVEGRVCLLLDATFPTDPERWELSHWRVPAATGTTHVNGFHDIAAPEATALLLIDGSPKWVWISRETAELVK